MKIKPLLLLLMVSALRMTALAQTGIPSATAGKTSYGNNPNVGKYANIRGFKMYYEIYGTGKPLLIIHGNGGSINNFENQIPYFIKNYQVILADSRAQGKSVDTSDSLTYEMMADDLNALLNTLKLDSRYVIGWSDGGIDGLLLAMRHPEKVKKLAITGANLWPDATAVEPALFRWVVTTNDSLARVTQTPDVKAQKKLLNLMVYNPHISTAELANVKCPTLVIGGDNDVHWRFEAVFDPEEAARHGVVCGLKHFEDERGGFLRRIAAAQLHFFHPEGHRARGG